MLKKNSLFEKILFTGIAILLIFAPIARGAVKSLPFSLFMLVEFGLIFFWFFTSPGLRSRTAADRPILIFLLLAVLSFIFSIYKLESFYALLCLLGYAGIYYVLLDNLSRSLRERLLNLIIFVGAGLSAYGLLQYAGILPHHWWVPREFPASTYVNHNHFAGFLELTIPVAIGMFFSRSQKRARYRLMQSAALLIMITAFILAQSRGGWISLAFSLLVMNFVLIKRGFLNRKSATILILVLAVIFSFIYFYDSSVSSRLGAILRIPQEASLDARVKIWQGALGMVGQSPLTGVGVGNFETGFLRFRPEGLHLKANFAHNDYLQAAAEMGAFAPLVMVWLIAVLFTAGTRRKTFSPKIFGCAVGILSLSLHGLVDFNFHIPANMLLFTVYAALLMSNASRIEA